MTSKIHRSLLFSFLFFLLNSVVATAMEVPRLRGRVNDLARLLPQERIPAMENQLAQFEQETGHQIVVLIVPSLEGEDPPAFALKTAEVWKLGQKGHDNWALLLVSVNDRKLRIEVGYGLEGVLPDAIASQIIRNILTQRFREKDYAGGIQSALTAMMQVTRGEPLPESARRPQNPQSNRSFQIGLVGLLAFIGAMAFVSSMQRQRSGWSTRGRRYPPVIWGGPFGGGGFGGGGFGGGGFGGGGFGGGGFGGGGGFSGGGGGGGGGGGASGSW